MPHILTEDIECGKIVTHGEAKFEGPLKAESGLLQRITTIGQGKCDAAAVGTQAEVFITLPKKSKITKFGIISAASDIVCSSSTSFELRTKAGVKLATFVPGRALAKVTIGSGVATGGVVATYVNANTPMRFCVGTDPADSGSVFYFVDFRPVDV